MIQRRGDRWRVVVYGGRDPFSGRRRQLSGTAVSRAEAVQLERRLYAHAAAGIGPDVTLNQLVEEWWRSEPRLAATTTLNYRSNLTCHVLPVLGLGDSRPRLLAAFFVHLRDQRGVARLACGRRDRRPDRGTRDRTRARESSLPTQRHHQMSARIPRSQRARSARRFGSDAFTPTADSVTPLAVAGSLLRVRCDAPRVHGGPVFLRV